MHDRLAAQLNKCVQKSIVPSWLVTGRMILGVKDKRKGNIVEKIPSYSIPKHNLEYVRQRHDFLEHKEILSN